MLQATLGDLVMGFDIHVVLVPSPTPPPVPIPVPVPMPFGGRIFDPIALLVGAGINYLATGKSNLVLVNHIPAANCGTNVTNLLTAPHIPAPGIAFLTGLPGNNAELFMGAHNVSIGGSFGVRLTDIAMSCSDPVRLPTSMVFSFPKGYPFFIFRPPAPDMAIIAAAAVFRLPGTAIRSARRFRTWQQRSPFWRGLSRRLRRPNTPARTPSRLRQMWSDTVCFFTGHPVDVATGRLVTSAVDVAWNGPLPWQFRRVYDSSMSNRTGHMGNGWSHSLDGALWFERGCVVYRTPDCREVEFSLLEQPDRQLLVGDSIFAPALQLTLTRVSDSKFEVSDKIGTVYELTAVKGGDPKVARLVKVRSRDRHHSVTLQYDERATLATVSDSCGRRVRLTHDEKGRLIRLDLPALEEGEWQRHRSYQYSDDGDLVSVQDALGSNWSFVYKHHLLVKETNRNGLSFYFQFDGNGEYARCIRTWGDGGLFDHEICYVDSMRKTLVENSVGHLTSYVYDEYFRIVEVIDAHGKTTKYVYDDETSLQISQIDPLGNATHTHLDDRGNVVRALSADGAQTTVEYNEQDQPVKIVDVLGNSWSFSYDGEGHLCEQVNPLGERIRYVWRNGLLYQAIDNVGRTSTIHRDQHKQVMAVQAPNQGVTQFERDAWGRWVSMRDARGATYQRKFDRESRMLEEISPLGLSTSARYDREGNVLEFKTPNRHVQLEYNGLSKVIARREGEAVVRFEYNTEEQLMGVVNEAGKRYSFKRDACGRVNRETDYAGNTREYFHDACGRLVHKWMPSGRQTKYAYDKAGRLVEVTHSDKTFTKFVYRADGRLVRAQNQDDVIWYKRDPLGRVVHEHNNDEQVASKFGPDGSRVLMESTLGARVAMECDALGLPKSLWIGHDFVTKDPTVVFDRDIAGVEISQQFINGISVQWQRDIAARPTQRVVERKEGGQTSVVGQALYQWRGDDQISAIWNGQKDYRWFTHDQRGRLVREQCPDGITERAMDAVGNVFRTQDRSDRVYGDNGQVLKADGVQYVYNEDGFLTRKTEKDGGLWSYKWNPDGRLTEVTRPDQKKVTFQYDPLGRRITKSFDGITTRWLWDGDVVVNEWVERKRPITWVFDPQSFAPLARLEEGEKLTVVSDHLGTPLLFVDQRGQIVEHVSVDLLGRIHGPSSLSNWRFPGQYWDEETELSYNRHRYYDPSVNAYVSADPIGLIGGLQLFGYVRDPSTSSDYWGLSECPQARIDRWTDTPPQIAGDGGLYTIRGFLSSNEISESAERLRSILLGNFDQVRVGIRGSSLTGVSSKGGDFRWGVLESIGDPSDVDFFS